MTLTFPSQTPEARKEYYDSNKKAIQAQRKFRRETSLEGRMTLILGNCKARAKRDGRFFDLTLEDLLNLWKEQEGHCALSGKKLKLNSKKHRHSSPIVSVDRVDSEKGYTKSNIQLVTIQVNLAKGSMSQGDFLNMCKRVVENSG